MRWYKKGIVELEKGIAIEITAQGMRNIHTDVHAC